jgi:hypothetical protein
MAWSPLGDPTPVSAEDALVDEWVRLYPPCRSEGQTDNLVTCVWDARSRGNGAGFSSLITDDGEVFYSNPEGHAAGVAGFEFLNGLRNP